MKSFCALLERNWPPAALRTELLEVLGEDLERLERLALFTAYTADRFPCPGSSDECPRLVGPSTAHGWLAVYCANETPACEMLTVRPEQLAGRRLAINRWFDALGGAAGIDAPRRVSTLAPGLYGLGRRPPHLGGEAIYYLAQPGRREASLALEAMVRQTAGGHAWCLIPTRARLEPALDTTARGHGVRFVPLEYALAIRDGALVLDTADSGASAATVTAKSQPYCIAITSEGERAIDHDAYRALCEREGAFDLFINGVVKPIGCSRSNATRGRKSAHLTPGEFDIIATLIRERRPRRPGALSQRGGAKNSVKMFEHARRKIDIEVPGGWRAFSIIYGDEPDANAYQFTPPATLRWCALLPLPIVDAKSTR